MQSVKRRTVLLAFSVICMVSSLVMMASERPSDDTIRFWVAEALREDPRIVTTAVDIRTTDGMVTLTGRVRSLAGKKQAGMTARRINGVRDVLNPLVVEPVNRDDMDILQDIEHRLRANAAITSTGIEVRVVDGIALLSGEVSSWGERQEAELCTSEVWGVKDVRNELKTVYRIPRSDEEIRNDVQRDILRDIYLSGLPISVFVTKGIVTIQGEVGNAYQKERALRVTRGVKNVRDVENNLTVTWWKEPGRRQQIPTPSNRQPLDGVGAEYPWKQPPLEDQDR